MTTRQLFELLGRVSEDHERVESSDSRTQVIPILLDGAAGKAGILRAFAEVFGGVLLDVAGKDYHATVPARKDDPELRAVLQESLVALNLGAEQRIQISVDETVDCKFLYDGTVQVATGAWATVLAISRALFSEDLDSAPLAVLLYSEAELDVSLRAKVLRVLCEIENSAIRVGKLKTLVVVIDASELSVANHCHPGAGIRYALLPGGPQYRKPLRELRGSVQRFVRPRDKPVVLFLGAGFSVSSRLPTGNALRDRTIARMTGLDPDNSSEFLAKELFRFARSHNLLLPFERDMGQETFTEKLTLEHVVRMESKYFDQQVPQTIEEFAELHERVLSQHAMGDAVLSLRKLVARRAKIILVTVNFDELVEQPADDLEVAVHPAEFDALVPKLKRLVSGETESDNRIPYLKLHGSIGSPETCVARDDQTLTGLDTSKRAALEALVKDATGDQLLWVYVGASMRDLDLLPVLGMHEFHHGVEEYWASPSIEPSVRLFAETRAHSWRADRGLDERMITEVADEFMNELVDCWDNL